MCEPDFQENRCEQSMTNKLVVFFLLVGIGCAGNAKDYLSPAAIVAGKDDQLYVAAYDGRKIIRYDAKVKRVTGEFEVAGDPTGITISGDCKHLYVTGAGAAGKVLMLAPNTVRPFFTTPKTRKPRQKR